jgi:hypothetical protein
VYLIYFNLAASCRRDIDPLIQVYQLSGHDAVDVYLGCSLEMTFSCCFRQNERYADAVADACPIADSDGLFPTQTYASSGSDHDAVVGRLTELPFYKTYLASCFILFVIRHIVWTDGD